MTSTQVQLRRGSTTDHATFIGAEGEMTVDTDQWLLVVHDGTTPGGKPAATAVYVDAEILNAAKAIDWGRKGSDIASAATLDLSVATGDLVDVTGTTTITAIALAEGRQRVVRFTGALTLTHGASLVLPGGASIVTAAGDFAIFRGYAAGVVRCVGYFAATGLERERAHVDIASAATTAIGGVASRHVRITGTTGITSFGTVAAGTWRRVRFAAALTITHNGTSLILPGAANITTAADDTLTAVSLGSGNWLVTDYQRANGKALVTGVVAADISAAVLAALAFGPFTSIASAATTNLSSVATIGVNITGTTTITSFGAGANLLRIGKFAAALVLTHNATSLILPGGANITTAAGDRFIALSDGSGNWTVIDYVKADGKPVAPVTGKRLKQIVRYTAGATWTKTTDVTAIFVRGVGGGGAGGSAGGGGSVYSIGGGGGAGAYGEVWVASPAASYAVTIGAGGSPGAAGNNPGGNGGTTSFGSLLSLGGGTGGNGAAGGTFSVVVGGGAGGAVSTGGDRSHDGDKGFAGHQVSGAYRAAGRGASSPFGSGADDRVISNTGTSNAGLAGSGYGAGGGGALAGTASSQAGGAGTAGYVEVWEYVDW